MQVEMVERSKEEPAAAASNTLVIKRRLEGGKVSVSTRCSHGHVTVLNDESGAALAHYRRGFCGNAENPNFSLELNGESVCRDDLALVGFDEKLPDLPIQVFLQNNGVPASQIDQLLEKFELKNQTFLLCSQLSPTFARQ